MIVVLEDGNPNSQTHEMDNFTVAILFQQTDTFIQLSAEKGVNGIAEFTVSYRIYCNSDPQSNPDPCEVPSALVSSDSTSLSSRKFWFALRIQCWSTAHALSSKKTGIVVLGLNTPLSILYTAVYTSIN